MTKRLGALLILTLVLSLVSFACGDSGDRDQQAQASGANVDTDTSQAPGMEQDAATPEGARTAPFNIRSNTIRTRHLFDGSVTAGKIALAAVTVNVNAAAATGSSAANPDLVGGVLISCDPAGNQDQHLDNAVLNGDGSITATLAANATAQNNFRCIVFKANAKGVS